MVDRFLVFGFDMDFLFMIDHLILFRSLLCIDFLLGKLLNNCQCSCLLFVVLCLRSGQFLFLLIDIQLFVLLLLEHFHVWRGFLHWLLGWLLTEILYNCQSGPLFVVFIHWFEPFVDILLLLFHMLVIHCYCNCFGLSLHCLVNNGFMCCCLLLHHSSLLGWLNLWMCLLLCLGMNLVSNLNCLLLMDLFMWLDHFNVVQLVLIWLFLWEVLNNSQCSVLVVFIKFCTSSQMRFSINNMISICVYLLSLLQLNMRIATRRFRLLDCYMCMGLC